MAVDATDLVAEAVRACGGSRGALVKRLELRSYGEDKIGRWLRGESKPRYDETIALLEVVGWLSTSGGRRNAPTVPADPLAALEATVDEMAERTAAALGQLQADVSELSARIPPAAGRRRETSG